MSKLGYACRYRCKLLMNIEKEYDAIIWSIGALKKGVALFVPSIGMKQKTVSTGVDFLDAVQQGLSCCDNS